ncbi:MAG: hypothetical protein HDT18_04455 [Oscillibacter sp.]|nr:hypothetical protein [Oscillibacter sp.]
MGLKVADKNAQQSLFLEIAGAHEESSVFYITSGSYFIISGDTLQRGEYLNFLDFTDWMAAALPVRRLFQIKAANALFPVILHQSTGTGSYP